MKVLGVITEYNPMHNGHIYHIQKAKEITKSDYVILVMSGSFTMTGNISAFDKFTKAKIATNYGVDLVIELPTIYSTSSSEYFATGAIKLLNSLKVVDCICFGAECNDIHLLENISDKMIKNEDNIWKDIKKETKTNTFATSRNNVLKNYLSENEINKINKPNNILAIEYIKALKKLKSNIIPYCIKRESNYDIYTSSTNIRKKIKENEIESIKKYVPSLVYSEVIKNNYLLNENIFEILRYKIIGMSLEELKNINEVTEGLESRIKKYIISCKNYDELLEKIKTKRYIENKIKRIFINILLNITKTKFKEVIKSNTIYAHILSINSNGKYLLSSISKSSKIPVYTSFKDEIISNLNTSLKYLIDLDIYSSNIHSIIQNENTNKDYTNKI